MVNALVAKLFALPVYVYRYALSPFMPMACRFDPTCSAYALEALRRHGPITGLWLAVKRIARCHPWGGSGADPVPPHHNHSQHRPGRHSRP